MQKHTHPGRRIGSSSLSASQPLVLIIDNDCEKPGGYVHFLRRSGYRILHAKTGAAALEMVHADLDCIVLDTRLPDMSGFDLACMLRDTSSAPILFLAAAGGEDQMARGFHLGDDYMEKPCNLRELSLRIGAHVRRTASFRTISRLSFPPLMIDLDLRQVRVDGKEVPMTPKEFSLISTLARAPNEVIPCASLFRRVWLTSEGFDGHMIAVNVSTLRKRLAAALPGFDFIRTEWSKGYMFSYPPIRTE
ncbi:MAG: response regulator transcription factor [Clostridia bacterium]|nr:response regulator transcription factor [Clostridia bacterium]